MTSKTSQKKSRKAPSSGSPLELKKLHKFTVALAVKAGELIKKERNGDRLKQNYKKGYELVTSADLKSDEIIRKTILKKFPDHRILSEESSPQLKDWHKGPLWIIDPIDGTVNYAYGHKQTAICIAFAMDGIIQTSAVHVPFERETFSAIRGQGAWLNGKKIKTSTQTDPTRSLIATGFPYLHDRGAQLDTLMRRLKAVLTTFRDIRRVGSAAIDACWVAMGRLDGYYESVHPWDIAAAGLIAREAGAKTGHLGTVPSNIPTDLFSENVIVANPHIYDQLLNVLSKAESN